MSKFMGLSSSPYHGVCILLSAKIGLNGMEWRGTSKVFVAGFAVGFLCCIERKN